MQVVARYHDGRGDHLDPLTQGLLGAAAAQALFTRQLGRTAWIAGAIGGVLPDADVLIRSAADPLLAIEYHRQFTHSLIFIPIGGAIAATPLLFRAKNRGRRMLVTTAAIAGYATHGLLDACTTYGTQLFWPFSNRRVAWDSISIIDPLFTLVLLIAVIVAAVKRTAVPAVVGLLLCLAYLTAGAVQRDRAHEVQSLLAVSRGDTIVRGEVFPTVGNNIVWRSLYRSGDRFFVDRIRVPWWGSPSFTTGTSVERFDEFDLPESVRTDPRMLRDFRRFSWFSAEWTARAPDDPDVVGDVRYSLRTDSFDPIWGIRFHPGAEPPTEWVNRTRDRDVGVGALWDEILGRSRPKGKSKK